MKEKILWASIMLLVICVTILMIVNAFSPKKTLETASVSVLQKGTHLGYEDYKGLSGKIYKVPIIADGQGGKTRWLADVLWADLPVRTRLGFAVQGGGMLSPQDLRDAWKQYGQWRKTGESIEIIVTPRGE